MAHEQANFVLQDASSAIVQGEIYHVNDCNAFRAERNHCIRKGLIEDHQSLVYHFTHNKRYCFYDYVTAEDNRGRVSRKTVRLLSNKNPFRYARKNSIPYDAVLGSSDETVCEQVQALRGRGFTLIGWELPGEFGEVAVSCFVPKLAAGSHHLKGTIVYRYLDGNSSDDFELGSLQDAVTALEYLRLHHISIEQARRDLQEEADLVDEINQAEAEIAAYNARTWVDDLPSGLQDFADQFPDREAFETYMEGRD